MERLFAVLNAAGNIVARGPAECAPDAALIKECFLRQTV